MRPAATPPRSMAAPPTMLRAAPPVYTGRVLEEVGEVKEEVDHTPVELATPLELDAVVVAVVQVHVAEVVLYPVALPETLEEVVVGHELLLPEWPQYVQSQLLYSIARLAMRRQKGRTWAAHTRTRARGVGSRAAGDDASADDVNQGSGTEGAFAGHVVFSEAVRLRR